MDFYFKFKFIKILGITVLEYKILQKLIIQTVTRRDNLVITTKGCRLCLHPEALLNIKLTKLLFI